MDSSALFFVLSTRISMLTLDMPPPSWAAGAAASGMFASIFGDVTPDDGVIEKYVVL
jgi:hypothetical protein